MYKTRLIKANLRGCCCIRKLFLSPFQIHLKNRIFANLFKLEMAIFTFKWSFYYLLTYKITSCKCEITK